MTLKTIYSRFSQDERGISAVEFAMIAPIMIGLMWGSMAYSSTYTLHKRVQTVADSAADLVARCNDINNDDLDDVIAASTEILRPFAATPGSNPAIQIISVTKDTNDVVQVEWSYPTTVTTVSIDTNLVVQGSSTIMATATYDSPANSIQQLFSDMDYGAMGNFGGAATSYSKTGFTSARGGQIAYTTSGEDCEKEDP